MNRRLLVLSLRGTLLDRLHVSDSRNVAFDPSATVGVYRYWVRPHAREFVTWAGEHFDLAIWSSATMRNNTPMIKALNVPGFDPVFTWSREHTRADDHRRNHVVEEDDSWATTKPVDLILREYPKYQANDVLVVDDSASKLRYWSHHFIAVPTFDVSNLAAVNDSAMVNLKRDLELDVSGAKRITFPHFVQQS